eukprot:UN3249
MCLGILVAIPPCHVHHLQTSTYGQTTPPRNVSLCPMHIKAGQCDTILIPYCTADTLAIIRPTNIS